jgi:hypothetical protein
MWRKLLFEPLLERVENAHSTRLPVGREIPCRSMCASDLDGMSVRDVICRLCVGDNAEMHSIGWEMAF